MYPVSSLSNQIKVPAGNKLLSLSKQDTSIMKGVAICAMLFHHLYCSIPDWIRPYDGLLFWLGDCGKTCVSLFLFCSGYGLSAQYGKTKGVKGKVKYLIKRFVSFYVNYWTVFVIFVPLTVFVFHRPLSVPYGESDNLWKCLALDLIGVMGIHSYNITWWFNKLIIVLWLLFPFLFWLVNKIPVLITIIGSLIIARYWKSVVGWDYYGDLSMFQCPFVLGILWQTREVKNERFGVFVKEHQGVFSVISLCMIALFLLLRTKRIIPHWSGVRMDPFLTCAIALFVIFSIKRVKFLSILLSFFGKHSGNIYLLHTFFNIYWCRDWLHASPIMRSGINFFVLLGICLLVSMLLELSKKQVGVYAIQRRMLDKLC